MRLARGVRGLALTAGIIAGVRYQQQYFNMRSYCPSSSDQSSAQSSTLINRLPGLRPGLPWMARYLFRRGAGAAVALLVWSAALLAGGAAFAQESYSPEEMTAAAMVHSGQLHAMESMRICAIQAGDRGGAFPFALHFWKTGNLAETLVSDMVWPAIPPARQAAAEKTRQANAAKFRELFNAADSTGKDRICAALLGQVMSGKMDFSVLAPSEAQVLKGVFDRTPGLRVSKRNADMATGCMKSIWNKGGRDFEAARSTCECSMKVLTENASDEQIDAYLAGLPADPARRQAYMLELGWMQQLMPTILACFAK